MEIKYMFYVTCIASMTSSISSSTSNCKADNSSLICKNIGSMADFPISVPANIYRVMLFGSDKLYYSFPDGLFKNETCANISELSLLEFNAVEVIQETFLDGLGKLQFLSISSCRELRNINANAFTYTPNLKALYLNRNPYLKLTVVEAAITGKLERLQFLSLKGIQAFDRGVLIGEDFSKSLRAKKVTYLDLGGVKTIIVNQTAVTEILSNVKFLNVSYSTLIDPYTYHTVGLSYLLNLEFIDVTSCKTFVHNPRNKTVGFIPFRNIKYIFAHHLVDQDVSIRLNETITFELDALRELKVLDLSKNNIIILNITFSGKYDFRALETIDLSDNNIEYISISFVSSFPSLKILNLSRNQLHKMQNKDEFSYLLSRNKFLEIIDLQNNNLSFVPFNFLSSNSRLRAILLSKNNLKYFNIDIHNNMNLRLIDLSKNMLINLTSAFYRQLQQISIRWDIGKVINISNTTVSLYHIKDKDLIASKYKYGYNASENQVIGDQMELDTDYVTLNILDNPFMCDCDSLDFVQMIVHADIAIANRTQVTCTYDKKEVLLNKDIMELLENKCRFVHILVTAISLSFASIAGVSVVVIVVCMRRRKALRNLELEHIKRELLHNNSQFNFVVFLSYCSRDSHIVDTIILPSIKTFLKETFNTQKELVCTGADNFVPGLHIIDEIHRCINESLVIVPVITPAFLESEWSKRECIDAIEKHREVVVLMKEHTNTSLTKRAIRQLIEQYTRASWMYNDGRFSIRPSWNTVCSAILQTAVESFRQHRIRGGNKNFELVRLME